MKWSELRAALGGVQLWPRVGHPEPWQLSVRRDVLVAIAALVVQLVGISVAARNQDPRRALDVAGYALLGLGPCLLVVRRRYPIAVAVVVFASTLSYWAVGYPRGPIFVALVIAFIAVVWAGYRAVALGLLVVGYAGFLWLPMASIGAPAPPPQAAGAVAAWLIALATASEVAKYRRQHRADEKRRQAEELRRKASEERLQIAREVHDVLAHSISVINVQAGVGLHLMDRRPEQARESLATIRTTSGAALQELRSLLGVLRQDPDEPAPRGPMPGLSRLEGLVASAAASGVRVSTEIEGRERALPTPVDHAAYRIAQEALTNVGRYARPAAARIWVGYGDSEVVLRVDDDGVATTAALGGGNGIAGMRERATALGGELSAGSRPGGGFRVEARLPTGPA